jgi:hypothetical protein
MHLAQSFHNFRALRVLVAIASLAAADVAHANLALLAGWDFNGGTSITVASVNARYSQSMDPKTSAGSYFSAGTGQNPGNAQFGTAYFSGSNGATFASSRNLTVFNAPAYDLLSTEGLLASNNSLGDMVTNSRGVTLSNTTTLDNARATFKISTSTLSTNYKDVFLQYSARNVGTAAADISFSYSLDGIAFTSLAGSTQTWLASGSFATSSLIDFSSITALNAQSTIWIGLDYAESVAPAAVVLDNVAIYAVIPEPSTYAALLAAAVFGLVALRRRRGV